MSMNRAVFDTNTVLQAILSDLGPAGACVKFVLEGRVILITSQEIIQELLGVISRPSLMRKYPQLRDSTALELISDLRERAEIVPQPEARFKLDRDEADEVFINLALESGADYLVSRDRDLLDLMDDLEFRERFPDLRIVTPVGFLEAIRAT